MKAADIKAIRDALESAKKHALMNSASFNRVAPTDDERLPKNEQEVTAFIRKRVERYHESYIVHPIDVALALLPVVVGRGRTDIFTAERMAELERMARFCGFETAADALESLCKQRRETEAKLSKSECIENWNATARRCGFESTTEALGYLLTKWERENTADIARLDESPPWNFHGLPRTRVVRSHTETGRGTAPVRTPVYYWAGRLGRPSSHRWFELPEGAELVVVDETRGDPDGPAPVCRIVMTKEPLALGHTLCISRGELLPIPDEGWEPAGMSDAEFRKSVEGLGTPAPYGKGGETPSKT